MDHFLKPEGVAFMVLGRDSTPGVVFAIASSVPGELKGISWRLPWDVGIQRHQDRNHLNTFGEGEVC